MQKQSIIRKASNSIRRPGWLSRKHVVELQCKNSVKQGQTTKEEFKKVVQVYRTEAMKAKAQTELICARDVKDKRECFYHCTGRRRLNKETAGLLMNEVCDLVAVGTDKAEVVMPPVPWSSPVRPHRPLYLVKVLKEEKSQQGTRTGSGIT